MSDIVEKITENQPLVEVKNLKKYFDISMGMFKTRPLKAVDDVSFTIERGKTLGIVGESGCGKTTTGRSILRLLEPTAGEVYFDGVNVTKLNRRELEKMRQKMQIIFQDPFSSLNPRLTLCQTIEEVLKLTGEYRDSDARFRRVLELMDTVGLDRRLINTFPHEMDGGRRQRLGIARALAINPSFIVCDEPVSALDVSIQAQILNLMRELQRELNLTYIFITHDLSVVNYISDDIAVMYMGRLIEKAATEELFSNPVHPIYQGIAFRASGPQHPQPGAENRHQGRNHIAY